MNEARPYASLSSGLLARKGTARPAMRPQGYHSPAGFEDLGWNDMGQLDPVAEPFEHDLPEHVPSSISALTPAPRAFAGGEPEVVSQQRAIAESFAPDAEADAEEAEAEAAETAAPAPPIETPLMRKISADVVPLPKRGAPLPAGKKAAFTLRLDSERHLRLRLAAAVTGRSAQQIVTGALDQLLATIPELETLAERVPAKSAKRS